MTLRMLRIRWVEGGRAQRLRPHSIVNATTLDLGGSFQGGDSMRSRPSCRAPDTSHGLLHLVFATAHERDCPAHLSAEANGGLFVGTGDVLAIVIIVIPPPGKPSKARFANTCLG